MADSIRAAIPTTERVEHLENQMEMALSRNGWQGRVDAALEQQILVNRALARAVLFLSQRAGYDMNDASALLNQELNNLAG